MITLITDVVIAGIHIALFLGKLLIKLGGKLLGFIQRIIKS